MSDALRPLIEEHMAGAARMRDGMLPEIEEFATAIHECLGAGGKLVVFGNGGSAADAQHFAAELTGHFVADRDPLAAIALSSDSSAVTAIGNDYGFGEVFARQVRALVRPGDVVTGISTSGESENVARGISAARDAGAQTFALTGGDGGTIARLAHRALVVPAAETARIQELHVLLIHMVCALIDDWAGAAGGARAHDA